MNNPIKALDKLESIILKWKENTEVSPMYFASSKIILQELNELAEEKPEKYNLYYTSEKVESLKWSLNSMFGCDTDNGHDFEQHQLWVLENIQSLKSSLCFGKSE